MGFIKKTWVNVPDPSEYTTDQLNLFPRFDADNMNRIENGIEEALNADIDEQEPTYTESSTFINIEGSGESVSIIFGKIKKAITELMSHLSNKENPHDVRKNQLGLDKVDNTSDEEKPVSDAQATAIADAKKAGTDAQGNLNSHTSNATIHITSTDRTTWNSKADSSHTHDGRYYTESEVDTKLNNKANSSHTHSPSDITSLTNTDYTTSRVRGIALNTSLPASIPNGHIVGIYV